MEKKSEEDKRLEILKMQYETEEIGENDISDEDMNKLIEIYEKETEELNNDTERRKRHIVKILKELK